ncbi:MAG TPA: hypothetical protein VMZ30_14655 [Pyrinomonadaceae bacterium]|nr:hypothetical protein [Pyrinomonadaceae bacterium]
MGYRVAAEDELAAILSPINLQQPRRGRFPMTANQEFLPLVGLRAD